MIPTPDDLRLALTLHEPAGAAEPRAVVIAPAVGNLRGRYAAFARFLAGRGWSTVAFDYRGMGDSRADPRDARVTMRAWGELDLAAVIDWTSSALQPKRLVVVGHSIGGQLVPFAPNHHKIDALLAVGAQKGYWRHWPGLYRPAIYTLFRHLIPGAVRLFGRLPLGRAGLHDVPPHAALEWARWGAAADYRDADGSSLRPLFAAFEAPVLALSFSDDVYAPKRAVDALFGDFYRGAPRVRCHLRPRDFGRRRIGHSGFFDAATCPARLWSESAEWLEKPFTGAAAVAEARGRAQAEARGAGVARPDLDASLWQALLDVDGDAGVGAERVRGAGGGRP